MRIVVKERGFFFRTFDGRSLATGLLELVFTLQIWAEAYRFPLILLATRCLLGLTAIRIDRSPCALEEGGS